MMLIPEFIQIKKIVQVIGIPDTLLRRGKVTQDSDTNLFPFPRNFSIVCIKEFGFKFFIVFCFPSLQQFNSPCIKFEKGIVLKFRFLS